MRRDQAIALALVAILVAVVLSHHLISTATLLFFAMLVPSIIVHEVSHGAVAYLFGDDTAKRAGRLTLNPISHIDLFGSIILPAVMLFVGLGAIGYAKPVPVNVARLRSPRNHGLLVGLAGPAVNIVLAVAAALALRAVTNPLTGISLAGSPIPVLALFFLGYGNVLLAAFNLIPLPPLDGSAVVERLLPRAWWPGYLRLRMYAMPVLLAVFLLVPGFFGRVFTPALHLWAQVLHRPLFQ